MRWPGRWEGKRWGGGKKLISSELSSSQGLKLLSPVGFIFFCVGLITVRCSQSKAAVLRPLAGNLGKALEQFQPLWLSPAHWECWYCLEDMKFLSPQTCPVLFPFVF